MYQIRYNAKKNHIAGITEATKGSEFNYALSACPALSAHEMAEGPTSDNLLEIVEQARKWNQKKLCMFCETAAKRELASMVNETVIEEPVIETIEIATTEIAAEIDEVFTAMKARAAKMNWTVSDSKLMEIKGNCTNRAYAVWKLGKAMV